MTRPPSVNNSSGSNLEYYENKKDAISIAHLLKNVNSNDSYLLNVSSNLQVENPTENGNYTISNLESYKDDVNQAPHINHCRPTSYQKIDPQKKYTLKKVSFNGPDLWNAENNVDFVLLVDQETQTKLKESKEASVQTDTVNKCTYTLLKKRKTLSNLNYSCLICQRFYSSKSSYDRHARTHVTNENVITNLHITTKSKFKIFEENTRRSSQSHIGLPMALQEPKFIKFQCGICCKSFSSQAARDIHTNNLALEEFPMLKCKECNVKFFTLGALQEHVYFVHERNTYKSNAYCCVFCNESFESSYSFQLHLDEHLHK